MNRKIAAIIWIIIILLSINISGCFDGEESLSTNIDESWRTIYKDNSTHLRQIIGISWNPNGNIIATRDLFSADIKIWNTTTWQRTNILSGHNHSITVISWDTDGSKLASCSLDGTVRIWDTSTWQASIIFSENDSFLLCLSWSPDGSMLAAANIAPYTVRIWDAETWEIIQDIDMNEVVESISWSPNGQEIAITDGRIIEIYNTITWQKKIEITDNPGKVQFVSYSPDGTMLALAINDENGTIKIWHTAPWKNIQSIEGYYGSDKLAWSPDSSKLAIWPNRLIVDIWNTSSWDIVQQLKGHTDRVIDLSWSPDGSKIASCEDEIKIWNVSG